MNKPAAYASLAGVAGAAMLGSLLVHRVLTAEQRRATRWVDAAGTGVTSDLGLNAEDEMPSKDIDAPTQLSELYHSHRAELLSDRDERPSYTGPSSGFPRR